MSEQARQNLAAPTSDKDPKADAKRKMTSAILEDENKKKDVYEFLEDDDDFEEFDIENDGAADDQMMIEAHFNEDVDRKLWQEDWDDEEVDEDFAKQLRSQIRK
eukprot:403339205